MYTKYICCVYVSSQYSVAVMPQSFSRCFVLVKQKAVQAWDYLGGALEYTTIFDIFIFSKIIVFVLFTSRFYWFFSSQNSPPRLSKKRLKTKILERQTQKKLKYFSSIFTYSCWFYSMRYFVLNDICLALVAQWIKPRFATQRSRVQIREVALKRVI